MGVLNRMFTRLKNFYRENKTLSIILIIVLIPIIFIGTTLVIISGIGLVFLIIQLVKARETKKYTRKVEEQDKVMEKAMPPELKEKVEKMSTVKKGSMADILKQVKGPEIAKLVRDNKVNTGSILKILKKKKKNVISSTEPNYKDFIEIAHVLKGYLEEYLNTMDKMGGVFKVKIVRNAIKAEIRKKGINKLEEIKNMAEKENFDKIYKNKIIPAMKAFT